MKILRAKLMLLFQVIAVAYTSAQVKQNQQIIDISDHKVIPANDRIHFIDSSTDKYIGTWRGKQGEKEFTVKIEKYTFKLANTENSSSMDLLRGGYKVNINGTETINTLNSYPITGSSGDAKDIYLYINVPGGDIRQTPEFKMTYLGDSKAKWELSRRLREGVKLSNPLSLPDKVILKKQ